MSDLISRQDAIDAIERNACNTQRAIDAVKVLPSVEPERKKGRWIHKKNVYGVVYCSECDYELHTNDTNFCPDCGADMR